MSTPQLSEVKSLLTDEAVDFLTVLHRRFQPVRESLLQRRQERQILFNRGQLPDFSPSTEFVRQSTWQIASPPLDLVNRCVEITGPAERKMMINALNSGAQVFMTDFEDSFSPTWENVLQGQINLQEAVRRTLSFQNAEGKIYQLNPKIATLMVRPRGWHLPENHFKIDDQAISASLFDFGLYFFHNAHELLKRQSGPYFYLPKLESHLEARLWNDVFTLAQQLLGVPYGTIKATVLIETIPAAFEMDEILYELRDHAVGLNAGRWDYIFSMIKKLGSNRSFLMPDRSRITMKVPFMQAYSDLLIHTCHRRGAHALGGMAAFIPSRKDPEINQVAITKVREDKEREAQAGFDGTWVAHPDLVSIAQEIFGRVLGSEPHQKHLHTEEVTHKAEDLLNVTIDDSCITEAGLFENVQVALEYLESWIQGVGAVAIHNLMEDVATAEICRAELWQWIHLRASLDDGRIITPELYKEIREAELFRLEAEKPGRFQEAGALLDHLVLNPYFIEFLTLPALSYLEPDQKGDHYEWRTSQAS